MDKTLCSKMNSFIEKSLRVYIEKLGRNASSQGVIEESLISV